MRRLRDRFPTCVGMEGKLNRGECFVVSHAALQDLENDLLSLQLAIADLENQNSELNDALINIGK